MEHNNINTGNNEINDEVKTEDFNYSKSILNDQEEFTHLKNVCSAFANYHVDSLKDIIRMERDFINLQNYYKEKLSFNWNERIEKLKKCSQTNYIFLLKVIKDYSYMFNFQNSNGSIFIEPLQIESKNIFKLRHTLRLLVRDWAEEGIDERKNCHFRMIEELKKYINPNDQKNNEELFSVLVPGAGLGRLVYELCKAGYNAQGNEFSYFMLLTSHFILNNTKQKEEFSIYPYIHNFNNLLKEEFAFNEIKIPDIDLRSDLQSENQKCGEMSMVAGEFVEIYKNNINYFDSVLTCFFIDTAHNIIEYIETIFNILKPGGIWINFGPLLYHYSDMYNEKSIELSWEELNIIITKKYKFKILKTEFVEATYSSDKNSLLKSIYNCIFFTAQKLTN